MASDDQPGASRLAALCSSLGRLTTEQTIEDWDDDPSPLITGKLIRINGQPLWLDFRYERLSNFCYSCGKLGHYAMYCKDIPYNEAETPPVQISTVPLLPPPSIIPAANTSSAVHSNREPTIIPTQPLQNPSDEHHTAIISFLPPKFLPYRHLVLIIARYS